MTFDALLTMSINDIYKHILKEPPEEKRLPVFKRICNLNGYTTLNGSFMEYDKSYAAKVAVKNNSSVFELPQSIASVSAMRTRLLNKFMPSYHNNDKSLYAEYSVKKSPQLNAEESAKHFAGCEINYNLQEEYCAYPPLSGTTINSQVDKVAKIRPLGNQTSKKRILNRVVGVNFHTEQKSSNPISSTSVPSTSHRSCSLCRTNGERAEVYESHLIRDSTGKVTCPVLRGHVCSECGATGDNAHTITYCPVMLKKLEGKPMSTTIALKNSKFKSNGKLRKM